MQDPSIPLGIRQDATAYWHNQPCRAIVSGGRHDRHVEPAVEPDTTLNRVRPMSACIASLRAPPEKATIIVKKKTNTATSIFKIKRHFAQSQSQTPSASSCLILSHRIPPIVGCARSRCALSHRSLSGERRCPTRRQLLPDRA